MLARVMLIAAGMSEGINQVNLIGNLGADPELRQTTAGPVLNLRVATNVVYFDKEGKKQKVTEWHRVTVWGRRAEGLKAILSKGSCVAIIGRLHTSSYEKDGQKKYMTEVVAENVIPVGSRADTPGELAITNGAPRPFRSEPAGDATPFV